MQYFNVVDEINGVRILVETDESGFEYNDSYPEKAILEDGVMMLHIQDKMFDEMYYLYKEAGPVSAWEIETYEEEEA